MAYSDATLAALMVTELGATGVALGLTDASAAIIEAVNEVAAILSVDDVADVDDGLKLRTIAKWQAWVTAEGAATNQYDLSSDGSALDRSQWWEQIRKRRMDAEALASRYSEVQAVLAGSGGVAVVTAIADPGSPYAWSNGGEWS